MMVTRKKVTKKTQEPAAEWVKITELKLWDKNPRVNDHVVDRIADSLKKFGWGRPIVVRKANKLIMAGNTTIKAAIKLGLDEAPVRFLDVSQKVAVQYALADNKLGELAEWDMPLLTDIMKDFSFDELELAGWGEDELNSIFDVSSNNIIEDEPPDLPKKPITKIGDLWLLNEHRLLCGDNRDIQNIKRLMNGNRAHCIFEDPPYGVSIGKKNRMLNTVQKAGRNLDNIIDDDTKPEDLKNSLLKSFQHLPSEVMSKDCTLFVTAPQGGELGMMMMMMMQEAGLPVRHVLIWKKNSPTFSMGRLDYDYQHEPILLTWGKKHKRPMKGLYKTSVWEIDKPRESKQHPTMKPVALYANAYLNNSDKGDNTSDLYAGSGTAFVASEQVDRRCYGMEKSPAYCDVIVERWQNLTGCQAILKHSRTRR